MTGDPSSPCDVSDRGRVCFVGMLVSLRDNSLEEAVEGPLSVEKDLCLVSSGRRSGKTTRLVVSRKINESCVVCYYTSMSCEESALP